KIGRYKNLENYIKDYPAPTALEEVQDWFDKLIKILSTFSSQLSVINDKSPITSLVGPRSINFRMQSDNIRICLKRYLSKGASSTVYLIDFENILFTIQTFETDVRPENILLDTNNNELVLADWESAIKYSNNIDKIEYARTILFFSPNILSNKFGFYIPKASDDLHSFIYTIYILLNPSKKLTIFNRSLALKAKLIREYWDDKVDVKLGRPL
ncbi:7560_t:CDS:2, partial [Dentiscutata erythropus]